MVLSSVVVPTSVYHFAVIGNDQIVYAEEWSFSGFVVWLIFLGNGRMVFCHFCHFSLLLFLTGAWLMCTFHLIPGEKKQKAPGWCECRSN